MPAIGEQDVLVRVRAAGVDPGAWHEMTGLPYLIRLGTGPRAPRQRVRGRIFAAFATSLFVRQRLLGLIALVRPTDVERLARLAGDGTIIPVIDRTYPLANAADAVRHLEAGHARGKVVLTV